MISNLEIFIQKFEYLSVSDLNEYKDYKQNLSIFDFDDIKKKGLIEINNFIIKFSKDNVSHKVVKKITQEEIELIEKVFKEDIELFDYIIKNKLVT